MTALSAGIVQYYPRTSSTGSLGYSRLLTFAIVVVVDFKGNKDGWRCRSDVVEFRGNSGGVVRWSEN